MSTDFELLARWRDGERDAGSELFERHFDALRRFFRNKAGPQRLEELIQKTMLVCVENRDSFEGRSSFRTYLFGVAHNVLRGAYREGKRQNERIEFGTMSVEDMRTGAVTLVAREQNKALLLYALRKIPMEFQVVLELYYWENMEGQELADALGIPLGTVRTRLRRGKQRLEKIIGELAQSEHQLTQTLSNLEDWARQLRDEVDVADSP